MTDRKWSKSLKRDWLKALRSGEYKQGEGFLCNQRSEFCCLGVLADISVDDDWVFVRSAGWSSGKWSIAGNLGLYLPEGFPPLFKQILMGLNDSGKSFKYIANYIEKKVPA